MALDLTSGQRQFAKELAARTGLNTRFVQAWIMSEESGSAAQQREKQGNHNWLNIGPGRIYKSPEQGAAAAAHLLQSSGYYKGIVAAAKTGDPYAQAGALVRSPWDAGHYRGGGGLRQLIGEADGLHGVRNYSASGALSSTTVPGSTQQIQLPSGGQVDLAGLLSRLGPAPHPQPMGIAPPRFSAGPKLAGQELQPVGQPQVQGVGDQLAALLAASGAAPSTISSTVPGRTVTTSTGSPSAKPGAGGLATFDGKRVSAWMVPVLRYARARGWKGTVRSGFRTAAEQDAAARNFGLSHYGPGGPQASNHRKTGYLQGAIDVTDPQTLDVILRRKHSRLQNAGPTDPVHFSVHRNGAY